LPQAKCMFHWKWKKEK